MSEAEASAMDALVDEVMDGRKAKEIASAPAAAVGAAAAEPGPMLNDDGPKDSNESSTPSIGFADPTEGVETEGETLDGDEVAVLRSERDGYLADSQRLAADFANYRKQSEKRVSDIAATQSAGLVRDLILVLDACDAALMQDSESAAGPIRTQLLSELTKNGLELLSPETDEVFDPEMHEAVMHEPAPEDSEHDGPIIGEVMRAGYTWKGRVVRPAMVKVVG